MKETPLNFNAPMVRALSVRQPWAWLIIHGGKDIENRTWHTKVRGRILVHASSRMTMREYREARDIADANGVTLPPPQCILQGGIIGSVEIIDCVRAHTSGWFFGPYGFVLRDPRQLPYRPIPGKLGFFDVPAPDTGSMPGARQ